MTKPANMISPLPPRRPFGPPLGLGLLLLAALLGTPAPGAAQDRLETTDGLVVTGEIKGLAQGKLTFDIDQMSAVTVELVDVRFLEAPEEFEIQTLSGSRIFGSLRRGPLEGTVVVQGITYPITELAFLRSISEGFWPKTSGYIDLGFNAAKANENVSSTLGAKAQYDGRRFATSVAWNSFYQNRSDASEIRRADFQAGAGYLVGDRARVGGQLTWETNSELSLDYRSQLGLGSSLPLVRSQWTELSIQTFVLAGREQYENEDETTESAEFSLTTTFDAFRYNTPELSHRSSLALIPSLTEGDRIRVNFQNRTSYEVLSDFFVALTLQYLYDSRPPSETALKDDWTVGFTVGWSW